MNKSMIKGAILSTALMASSIASATTFDFAAIANGDSSYGFTGGEFGATAITFTQGGLTLIASGSDTNTNAIYNAYLDSSWTHSGGGGNGGLGVCQVLSSGAQCNPGSDDNVTINENLMLSFDTQVTITDTTFRNGEHNTIFGDGAEFDLVIDRGLVSEFSGTFTLEHLFTTDITGTTFEFMNLNTIDTDPFRFYISAMEVTAVPVPAAVWLFGSGLLGLAGIARRKRS